MVYALLGTLLGTLAALSALLLGSSFLTAFLVYMATGTACLVGGLAIAAICLWRNPEGRRDLSPRARRDEFGFALQPAQVRRF